MRGRRRSLGLALAACALGLQPAGAAAAGPAARARGVAFGPPAAWVRPVEPQTQAELSDEEASEGTHYLLVDRQVRVSGSSRAVYGHYAQEIVTDAGLETSSQVSVGFDPAYQRLTMHSVRVFRAGVWRERLRPGKLEVIQREPELEAQMFDGRQSAVMFVEDLRVGDVLDFSYTIEGANPVFDGRYYDSFSTEWSVPLHHMRQRLLWPRGRALYVRNHKTTLAPQRRELGEAIELVWEQEQVPALPTESHVPSDYETHGWVQLSELESWAQVAAWGVRLFAAGGELPAELGEHVARWQRQWPEPADRVVAAARFVQDEVRYVGIEMGAGSHRPSPPATVASRRFGDCKDKALLLVTILRRMGVEATPALVASGGGAVLDNWQPSPLAFDHVAVRVTVDGVRYWLDATRSAQGGRLGAIHFPDFERALVLEAGETALSVLPTPRLGRPTTSVRESFSVTGLDAPVAYDVETRYEGLDADGIRADLQRETREDVARRYVKYYAQVFPSIRQTAALETTDDREANVLVTREHYSVPRFFSGAEDPQQRVAEFRALAVDDAIGKPGNPRRLAPLAVRHPVRVRQVTEVALPEAWVLPADAAALQTPGGRLSYRAWQQGGKLMLQYDYESLRGSIPALEVARHVQLVGRMRSRLSYTLRLPPETAHSAGLAINWPVLATLLSSLPLLAIAGLKAYRHRPPPARGFVVPDERLDGLGGGLLAVALVLLQATWVLAAGTRDWLATCLSERWFDLTTRGSPAYHPLWAPLLLLEMLANLACLTALAVAFAFFLRRRRGFPAAFGGFLALWAAAHFVVTVLAQSIPERHAGVAAVLVQSSLMLLPACGCVPYLLRSDRARSTFTR